MAKHANKIMSPPPNKGRRADAEDGDSEYILRSSKCLRNGKRIYASSYGKKAFKIRISKRKGLKAATAEAAVPPETLADIERKSRCG